METQPGSLGNHFVLCCRTDFAELRVLRIGSGLQLMEKNRSSKSSLEIAGLRQAKRLILVDYIVHLKKS